MGWEEQHMTDNTGPGYISVEAAAEYLKVHPETIRRLLRKGDLKGKKTFLRKWMVEVDPLVELKKTYRPLEGE